MGKQLLIAIFFAGTFFSLNVSAQHRSMIISPVFKQHRLLYFFPNADITQTQHSIMSMPLLQQVHVSEISSGSINDLPFFCAMECRLRGRTGLWIKFRTGDDASYEKLIKSPEK